MSYNPRGAAMWRRFLAPLLDILTVAYAVGYLLALVAGETSGHAFRLKGTPALAWFALVFLYFLIGWRYAGGTVWDRLLGVDRPQPAQRRDPRPRAGFWRRTFAFVIDGLIVTVVFQLIVAALFATTSGRVQMYGDLRMSSCTVQSTTPAPASGTVVRECSITFFGLPIAKRREVAPPGEDSAPISAEMIDANGNRLDRWPVDWIAFLALMAYVLIMQARTGATLGGRAMGLRVVDTASAAPGVPLPKLARRYGAMMLGLAPMLVVLFGAALLLPSGLATVLGQIARREDAIEVFSVGRKAWYSPIWGDVVNWSLPGAVPDLLAEAVWVVMWYWIVFLLAQVMRKDDPLYDSMAGTAVVRVPAEDVESEPKSRRG